MKNLEDSKCSKIRIPTVALAIYFILMPFDLFTVFGSGTFLKVYALIPCFFCFINFIGANGRLKINNVKWFLYYIFIALFSLIYTVSFELSFSIFISLLINIVLVIICGEMFYYNNREITLLKNSLIIGGYAVILLTYIFADYSIDGRLTLMIDGNRADPNYINGYLFFAYIFNIDKLITQRKVLRVFPLGIILYFILMTGSRGALLSIMILTLSYILYYIRRRRTEHFVEIVVSVILMSFFLIIFFNNIIVLLPAELSNRFRLEYIYENGTTGRLEIWKALLNQYWNFNILRKFFGAGLMTTIIINPYEVQVAHNIFIDILCGIGIIGLAFFIGLHYDMLKRALIVKDPFILCTYIGYLAMYMSLSLITYKPMFNCMILILIIYNYSSKDLEVK